MDTPLRFNMVHLKKTQKEQIPNLETVMFRFDAKYFLRWSIEPSRPHDFEVGVHFNNDSKGLLF